jgi:hypothetical protein
MFFPSSSFFSSSGVSLLAPIGTDVCSCDRCMFYPSRPPPVGSQSASSSLWQRQRRCGGERMEVMLKGHVP